MSLTTRGLALSAFFACLLSAQNLQEFEKNVTEFRLANGLHFIVLKRPVAPVISFNTFVNVGAVDDPGGESSMAHMFEHMIGKGTRRVGSTNWPAEKKALERVEQLYDQVESERRLENRGNAAKQKDLENQLKDAIETANSYVDPNAFVRTIEENGGVGFNAGTAQDYTTYFYSLPANKSELWFLLQSEWLRHPVFREFYKERDVVREERRMRVESSTQGKLQELILATAFMAHPYRNTIGWPAEIEALRAKEAAAFHKRYYVPGNITITIVGDVDPARMKALAEKYFASIPAGPMPPAVEIVEPPQEGEKRAALQTDSQPVLFITYKRPNQLDPDDPVLDVLASILSSGRTGLMYQDLVRDRKLALGAGAVASLPSGKYPNLFGLISVPSSGHTVEENEKAIYEIVEKLKKEPVDAQTLERVKTNIRAGLLNQLASNPGLASQLAFYQVEYGDWRTMFTGIDKIAKVSAADVQRVANKYLGAAGRTVAFTTTLPVVDAAPKAESKESK